LFNGAGNPKPPPGFCRFFWGFSGNPQQAFSGGDPASKPGGGGGFFFFIWDGPPWAGNPPLGERPRTEIFRINQRPPKKGGFGPQNRARGFPPNGFFTSVFGGGFFKTQLKRFSPEKGPPTGVLKKGKKWGGGKKKKTGGPPNSPNRGFFLGPGVFFFLSGGRKAHCFFFESPGGGRDLGTGDFVVFPLWNPRGGRLDWGKKTKFSAPQTGPFFKTPPGVFFLFRKGGGGVFFGAREDFFAVSGFWEKNSGAPKKSTRVIFFFLSIFNGPGKPPPKKKGPRGGGPGAGRSGIRAFPFPPGDFFH